MNSFCVDRFAAMDTSLWMFLWFITTVFLGNVGHVRGQSSCKHGSCYPATGDLLVGRESQLTASSTCGLERPQRYCVVSYLEKATKCFTCDSRHPWMASVSENSHRIENIVSSFKGRRSRWWQAEAGREKVSIQLDLEAEFHFTHLIMTFKTFRPKAMLIERSSDFGKTWLVYRYYAQNCQRSFPNTTNRLVRRISDVICEEKYSAETPSSYGEVIFRALPPSISIPDPYSQDVQDLLKLTNLRINFTELHTLGDTHLDHGPEIKEKYYYSLYDVTVRGSCSCYGHASRCFPAPGYNRTSEGTSVHHMVHGMCECTHNTKGLNCEMCQDFYHDHPWSPAGPHMPNVCQRCNCNNHSTECHFDAARFQASGGMSGGVCDNCMHNTRGVNCQDCRPFYFQDPKKDIRDHGICQPCDCDTLGSQNKGDCQQVTNTVAGTVAGRCICKPFVTGERCDSCAENYWNLQADNPLGCEPCRCNPLGVAPDVGCNKVTGQCTCKRFVTGKTCDSCYPGFYGLSADNRYGCYVCDCDIGGAVAVSCHQSTGQCICRSHIWGKQCRQLDPGFFYAHLDYYTFEAEYGRGIGNARVYIREPVRGSPNPWTGPGYMKVMEGDSIEFFVSGLPYSTYWNIVVRYDNRMPDVFRDVRVSVIRPGQVRSDGPCGDLSPRDDLKSVSLRPGVGHQIVTPPSCLEQGTAYTIRLDLNTYIPGQRHREATLLIDSIFLTPNINYIPMYRGPGLPEYLKNELLQKHCDIIQFPATKSTMPDICQNHTFSISAVLHNGAIDCDCDRIGSVSLECNPSGGQCDCRPNVVGRHCDQCAPGTFGLGPRGCSPCNCHEIGARDNFCNEQTGQCTCIENIAGRTCEQCRVGFWGFPQCRTCQCHGNADRCDTLTGVCLGCRDFTAGSFCERCEPGYYGDPQKGVHIPCKPCLCPGGPTSSIQHADTCSVNPVSQELHCHCRTGYTGRSCETCIDNYYGAPALLGGQCQACTCNNNINPDDSGNCDGRTGKCLKCLFNTHGFACEHCRAGYYGDATKQNCARCVCYLLGTESTRGECDHISGQCPCLPNVVGQQCDRCASGHWNIASREGCTPCNCDHAGSVTSECNQLTGLCDCLPGRGGPSCADCENFFYGDPYYQCLPCDCNIQGSMSGQCDRHTGQCVCLDGVTGYKCDRCARGTTGDLPNCVPCGECFDNWEKVIMDMREPTYGLVRKANDVSVSGAIRAFDEEFRMMQRNIDEVKNILSNFNYTHTYTRDIRRMLVDVKNKLTESTMVLNEVDKDLRVSTGRVRKDSFRIQLLKSRVDSLRSLARELQDNVTNIQIQEVGGASGKVGEAEILSRAAQKRTEESMLNLVESERWRRETDTLVNARQGMFQDQLKENAGALDRLESDIMKMGGDLSDINDLVCGQPAAPCSVLCGGGGCGRCGGDGCSGAVTVSQGALTVIKKTEELLDAKNMNATLLLPTIQEARQDAFFAMANAKMAFNEADMVKNQTKATRVDLEDKLQRIRHFLLGSNTTSSSSVEKTALDVLALQIPLNSEHIQELAYKINRLVTTLSGIEKLLDETAENRATTGQLKQQAEQVLTDARTTHKTATEMKTALTDATTVQARAEEVLDRARTEIISVEDDFDMMNEGNEDMKVTASATKDILDKLKARLDQLTMRYTALGMDTLDKAERVVDDAQRLAREASDKAKDLDISSSGVAYKLTAQHNTTRTAKNLAEKLKARADTIFKFTETKMNFLKGIKGNIGINEKRLADIQNRINAMNILMDDYLSEIKTRTRDYETC